MYVAFQEEIDIDIWLKTGTKRDTRYIPVHTGRLTEKFGNNLCSLLLPFHTLLGCDSTSAFMDRGRQKGFQLLRSSTEKYMEIAGLGSRVWCLTVSLSLSIGILGQVWYLVVSIPDLCTLTFLTWRFYPT